MTLREFMRFLKHTGMAFSVENLVLIIDEIPVSALIFDEVSKRILCVNLKFTEMSGFGNQEIRHNFIDDLFPDGLLDHIADGQTIQGAVNLKNKQSLPISIKKKRIIEDDQVSLLIFEKSVQHGNAADFSQSSINEIQKILRIGMSSNIDAVIDAVTKSTEFLFNTNNCVIYFRDGPYLINQRDSDPFPLQLPVIELDRLQNIDFWYPGKRILCETHRIGRKNGFRGLLTAPIKSKDRSGLILCEIQDRDLFVEFEAQIGEYFSWVDLLLDLVFLMEKLNNDIAWLRHQNNRFSTFIENSNDLMVVVDEKNLIEYASDPFLYTLKYSSYEILNKKIEDLISQDDLQALAAEGRSGDQPAKKLLEMHDREGNMLEMRVAIHKVHESDSIKTIFGFTNVSAEKNLSKSMERIEKQASLGESIADFAHDVRNPLNNISTGLQMLRKVHSENEQLIDAVDRMQSDCIRMSDLIESVLSFSRQKLSEFSPIDLVSLAESVMKRFGNKFEKLRITHLFQV